MQTSSPPPLTDFLAPRWWPTWLGIALLSLLAWMPHRVRAAGGALIGWLTYGLAHQRRYITRTNIALCFPELDAAAREALVRGSFLSSGQGLVETVTGWMRNNEHFRKRVSTENLEELLGAKAEGRGVLLLGAHYSTLDFAANLFSLYCPFAVTYRAHKNRLFDAFMLRGRLRNCNGVFDRNDMRGALRHLKRGEVLWYAPDQDYGPSHAVYAPFFGVRAATITTPRRLAAFNRSAVIVASHYRRADGSGYVLCFHRLREDYPSDDPVGDASLINAHLEAGIRRHPEQYLWMHKRFKTQPGGKPESPYLALPARRKRLRASQLDELLPRARLVTAFCSRERLYDLGDGRCLHLFPGLPAGLWPARHAAYRLERQSRELRLRGIATLCVDIVFRVPERGQTAVSYFAAPGDPLTASAAAAQAAGLGAFLAELHAAGVLPALESMAEIAVAEASYSLTRPLALSLRPSSLGRQDRHDNLDSLCRLLQLSAAAEAELRRSYHAHEFDGNRPLRVPLQQLSLVEAAP